MKAEMNKCGVVTLVPETGVEAYALKAWCDKAIVPMNDVERKEQYYTRGSMLLVRLDLAQSEGRE